MRRRIRPRRGLVAAVALIGLAAACSSSDGRALPPPGPDQTTSTSTTATEPPAGEREPFILRTSAFTEGAAIPERLTCFGADVSPDLSWTGTPPDVAELAVVVRDRDAGGFVHWLLTGIDPSVQGVGEAGIPENAVEGPNDGGTVGWFGPCPPAGSGPHTYEIVLHALPAPLELPAAASAEQIAALIEASSGERAVITGTVTAPG